MMVKTIKVISLVLASLWLAACIPQGATGGPLAWIDSPLDGSVFPVILLDVISHASDPSGISQFELWVNSTLVRSDASPDTTSTLVTITQPWNPTAPGDYTVQVRAQNTTGNWSEFATVNVRIGFPDTSPTHTAPPLPTSTPTFTPSPDYIGVTFTPIQESNCRYGPGQLYAILTTAPPGDPLLVEGRNEYNNWVYVHLQGTGCWIALTNGTLDGDINQVPFQSYPPPPATATPVLGCYEYNQAQQPVCVVPCPPNAQPGGSCTP